MDLAEPAKPAKKSGEEPPAPANAFEIAMSHGAAPSTQLVFDVRVRPAAVKPGDSPVIGKINPTLNTKSLVRYDFEYALAPDEITLADGSDGMRNASIVFDIAAFDDEGKLLNILSMRTNLDMKAEAVARFLQKPLGVPFQLDLPPGHVNVRVGVLDVPSGKIGTLEIPVTVRK